MLDTIRYTDSSISIVYDLRLSFSGGDAGGSGWKPLGLADDSRPHSKQSLLDTTPHALRTAIFVVTILYRHLPVCYVWVGGILKARQFITETILSIMYNYIVVLLYYVTPNARAALVCTPLWRAAPVKIGCV